MNKEKNAFVCCNNLISTKRLLFIIIPFFFVYILLVDHTSLFPYIYSLCFLYVLSCIISKRDILNFFAIYHIYLIIAILIFLIYKYQDPNYLGLNGEEHLMDDSRFYAQLVDGNVNYPVSVSLIEMMPFVILFKLIFPLPIFTPLNAIIFNVVFSSFLPYFISRFAYNLFFSMQISAKAFKYTLFCPFLFYFGIILLRDIFVTVTIFAGFCYFLEKKFVPLLICVILVLWIRFGSILFLLLGLITLLWFKFGNNRASRVLILCFVSISLVAFIYNFSVLQDISGGKLEEGLIRSVDSERYDGSTIGKIMMQPFPINVLLSSLFFVFLPLLSFASIFNGHIDIGSVFQALLTPLFMFPLWNKIYNCLCNAFCNHHNKSLMALLYLLVLFAIALGTVSLQSRHKTVLFPLMCIAAAYGDVFFKSRFRSVSRVLTIVTIMVNLLYSVFIL